MYKLILSENLENLQERCEAEMKGGFFPSGGVTIEYDDRGMVYRYIQVMISDEYLPEQELVV